MPEPLPLALQLYTLRHMASAEEMLELAAAAGYSGVETVGTHGLRASQMRAALDRHGLRVVSSHVALDALVRDLERVLGEASELGNDTLVMPYLRDDQRPRNADGWRSLGARLGAMASACAERGIRLLYHNHDFELRAFDGRTALAWLLDAGAPGGLGFEPDVAWLARSSADPVAVLEEYGGRCPRVHVKDLAPAHARDREGGWAAAGQGVLDWDALLPAIRRAGAEWLIVEHDEPLDARSVVTESREFLTRAMAGAA